MAMFKKGDRVKIIGERDEVHAAPIGGYGIIRGLCPGSKVVYAVEVEGWGDQEGHHCENRIPRGHSGQWISVWNLEKVEVPKLIIYVAGNTTHAKLLQGNKLIAEACASCSPADNFDILVGAQIALQRLAGKTGSKQVTSRKVLQNVEILFNTDVELCD